MPPAHGATTPTPGIAVARASNTFGQVALTHPEFLFLGGAHLDRWRGNALARVGDAEALERLAAALARLPPTWARARSGLLVDLAYAHAAAGDRNAALDHAREARSIARQISSDRQLRRLDQLTLPTGRPP